jgi:hypothetical protein
MPGILTYCTDGNTDIPEACDIRIQFLYTEIDTFPAQGIHHGCVFNYTWRDESDKVIEEGTGGAFFSLISGFEKVLWHFLSQIDNIEDINPVSTLSSFHTIEEGLLVNYSFCFMQL